MLVCLAPRKARDDYGASILLFLLSLAVTGAFAALGVLEYLAGSVSAHPRILLVALSWGFAGAVAVALLMAVPTWKRRRAWHKHVEVKLFAVAVEDNSMVLRVQALGTKGTELSHVEIVMEWAPLGSVPSASGNMRVDAAATEAESSGSLREWRWPVPDSAHEELSRAGIVVAKLTLRSGTGQQAECLLEWRASRQE